MYIRKIEIENFRQLKDISIDIEEQLSLIIGKNNCGKTSILTAIDKLLNEKTISAYDFNLDFIKEIESKLVEEISEENFSEFGIKLRLYIEYTEQADLSNISQLIMDLDPDNNSLVLGFEYLISDYNSYNNFQKKYIEEITNSSFDAFFLDYQKDYFKFHRRSYLYDTNTKNIISEVFTDIYAKKININKVINFKFISAKRDVQNRENDKTLSEQSHKIYKETEKTSEQEKPLDDLKNRLKDFNTALDPIYDLIFESVIDKVKKFGGLKESESTIRITSKIKQDNLLKDNTEVIYTQNNSNLPESHNGLGYMNLINMIFEIEMLIQSFIKQFSDINLLIIEEPEAHTHPQMQYIFIKNIKELLTQRIKKDDDNIRNLQYMITSHSSHIVADSDFDDIKYLKKEFNTIKVKNLKTLKADYDSSTNQYQFLKQYLTLNRAELFFADKAILYEGDTERILLPSMMKKLDIAMQTKKSKYLPLCSQNISLVEVGAYVQIYEKFLEFIGIKTLVITDIDSCYKSNKLDSHGQPRKNQDGTIKQETHKCQPLDQKATFSSNSSLKYFFEKDDVAFFLNLQSEDKCLLKNNSNWVSDPSGWLKISYQTTEGRNKYCARSFEDAFININRTFITKNKTNFNSLKNIEDFDDKKKDAYELAENCIEKKTHFALDIIYCSDETMSNWKIPAYIKEGLEWLQKD